MATVLHQSDQYALLVTMVFRTRYKMIPSKVLEYLNTNTQTRIATVVASEEEELQISFYATTTTNVETPFRRIQKGLAELEALARQHYEGPDITEFLVDPTE